MRAYLRLMRFHQPVGIVLLLWPTLWGLWVAARGWPNWRLLLIFTTGVVVMRALGCVINDLADRNFDGMVKRTQDRPLATGELNVTHALGLLVLLSLSALGLAFLLPRSCFIYAVIGSLLCVVYPFMKRWFKAPQLVLGIAFAWGIPIAYAANSTPLDSVGLLLFAASVLWPIAYDTLYAMADRDEDQYLGIHSTALWWGAYDRLMVGLLQLAVLVLLFSIGIKLALNRGYFVMLSLALFLMLRQQFQIRLRDANACFQSFRNNAWVGLLVWLGFVWGLR